MKKTKKLTLTAILSALSVVLLLLGSVAPTAKLALTAAAGLLPAAAVVSAGIPWGAACYAVTAGLSLLLLPQKACAILFLLFFGHYGVLKALIEQIRRLPAEWLLKLAAFNGCLAAIYFLFRTVFTATVSFGAVPTVAAWLCCNAVFVIYDIGFSKLISLYSKQIGQFL